MMKSYVLAVVAALGLAAGAVTVVRAQQGAGQLTTEDYIDIQRLYARYNVAIDTGDGEGWAGTFTADGVFGNTNKGHDALVQFIRDWREKRDGANRRHWNSNLVLTPTAEGANGSIYLILLNIAVRPAAIVTGMYEDTLVKTPQGWRFKTRVVRGDPAPRPVR